MSPSLRRRERSTELLMPGKAAQRWCAWLVGRCSRVSTGGGWGEKLGAWVEC